MEIPVIHEKTSTSSNKNKKPTHASLQTRKDKVDNASSPSSCGYSRSSSIPFAAPPSSSSMLDRHTFSHNDYTAGHRHQHHHFPSNLTNQDSDFDHVTLKDFNLNSDADLFTTMMMTNDDLSNFHSNAVNNSNSNSNSEQQGFRSLHARLPSTDSGIQADAGFDSLSRYKGKHLLSSTNAAVLAAASGAQPNPAGGIKLPDFDSPLTPFNHYQQSSSTSSSAAMTSPNDSNNDSHASLSPQEISSGYGSDIGVSSPSSTFSPLSPTSYSPSTSISPSSRTPIPVANSSTGPSPSRTPKAPPASSQSGEFKQKSAATTRKSPESHRVETHSSPSPTVPTQANKPSHRQTSVPAVAPKPRVSLSRKPAFLGRGGNSVKPPVYSGGGGISDSSNEGSKVPSETLSLSSGIKVIKKENGVEVCIPTKPAVSPKNAPYNDKENNGDLHHRASSHSSQHDSLNGNESRGVIPSDSHNSSIDILSPDGSSVKIQVVKSGMPSFSSSLSSSSSSSSSSYFSSPSTISQSHMNTHPQMATAEHTTTVSKDNNNPHLTRPLRIATSNATTPSPSPSLAADLTTNTTTTTNSVPPSTSSTLPNPKWRSKASISSLHNPPISSFDSITTPNLHHPSERQSPSSNIKNPYNNQTQTYSVSEKQNHSTSKDTQKAVNHIPIKTIKVSHSIPRTPPNPSLYSSVRRSLPENNNSRPINLDYSKTTPISVITNTTRNTDRKQYATAGVNSVTTSPSSTVISSPPPTIVMSPPPSQPPQPSPSSSSSPYLSSSSKKQTSSPVIDSCIFRFKSPESSVFKQTFYDNNKVNESTSSPSSPKQQQPIQKQQQLLRPTYLPAANRIDSLKKNLKSNPTNGKSQGTSYPGVVMRRTDDIIKEALDFFNSRDDEDWDKLFSKSSFFDDGDDDMEKIFSKCWKTQDHDEFDKLFSQVFKRRKGSLDVDTRFGVSVDEDDDTTDVDRKNRKSGRSPSTESIHDKTTQSKTGDKLDSTKPRDVTSSNGKGEKSKGSDRKSSSSSSSESWKETKQRMDSALSWLQHELADLRAMDKSIVTQFRRCQDTIESLQAQREVWEGLEEETEFWDDMEISEFNRRCQESPGSSSLSPVSTGSRDISMTTSDNIWSAMRNGGNVIQDVEATL